MSRISIDVTSEEHQRLKALAALQGKTIKEFVLASTLGAHHSDAALAELESFLDRRLANSGDGRISSNTVADILAQVKREVSGVEPDGPVRT